MDLNEVKAFLDTNKDTDEVKNFLGSLITKDSVLNYLTNNDEGKQFLNQEKDTHFKKSLEAWQKENMPKFIDEEISKRYPAETEEQKRLKALEVELENEKKSRIRSELKNKAISHLTSKGLPHDLADYFLGEDENKTLENLQKFETVWSASMQKAVEEKFKGNGREPYKGGSGSNGNEDLEKASMEDYIKARQGK